MAPPGGHSKCFNQEFFFFFSFFFFCRSKGSGKHERGRRGRKKREGEGKRDSSSPQCYLVGCVDESYNVKDLVEKAPDQLGS